MTFGKLRYLGLAEVPSPLPREKCWALIRTLRGLEMGLLGGVLSQEQQARYRTASLEESREDSSRGPEPMLQEVEFLETADEGQVESYYELRAEEEVALLRARAILAEHQLQMKLVEVEYMLDRKKLFFYFTSEQRVDFRAYVRDLAREFRTRIEMRQIGVRDEARAVRGIAPCGRPCCCSSWLHRFTPICIRMVKEQNLALNPAKISGICGRLMCCMAYEHPIYQELWRSLPNPGAKIKTEQGNYVLEGVDLNTKCVKIRFPGGREIPVSIEEFPDFKEAVLSGEPWETEDALPLSAHPRGRAAALKTRVSETKETKETKETEARPRRAAGRRFKPEKVSLDEHLAGRPDLVPIQEKPSGEPSPEGFDGALPKKKKSRRRKSRAKRAETTTTATAEPGPASKESVQKKSRTQERRSRSGRSQRPDRPEAPEQPEKGGGASGERLQRARRRPDRARQEGAQGESGVRSGRERPRRPENVRNARAGSEDGGGRPREGRTGEGR
ncbi:MAG: hypothetical protein GX256_07750 [Fretibacterium sp.]|nr:hypothetical protein [Fretibacterium sp.]